MQIKFEPVWKMEVSNVEARLILRALGGRLKGEQEIAEAKALGDLLTKARADETRFYAQQMQEHADQVKDIVR